MKQLKTADLKEVVLQMHRTCWICKRTILAGYKCQEAKGNAICYGCVSKGKKEEVITWED